MQKTFCRITNVSDCTYWSFKADRTMMPYLTLFQCEAIAKHGEIYINRHGGWMPASCVKTIHQTIVQSEFPPERNQKTS